MSRKYDLRASGSTQSIASGTNNFKLNKTTGAYDTYTSDAGITSSDIVFIGKKSNISDRLDAVEKNISVLAAQAFISDSVDSDSGSSIIASKLKTARTISLTGDVTGSVSFDGSQSVSISTTSASNSIVLGTDTTGNYVASLVAGTGITLANNTGETATPTVTVDTSVIAQKVDTTYIGTTSVALNRSSANLALTGISSVALPGATSGTITLTPTAVAGTTTLTLPGTTDTLVGRATTDTLTNKTIAAGSNTISGIVNANLSGTAGITNANLANSSVTVTAGTGMSGGGAVSLGGSVTVTNAGVTALTTSSGLSANTSATGAVSITNTGVLSITTNTGLSTNASATGAITITNTGVTSNVAGTGISVSGATGAVTITNTGVTSAVAGTGVSVSAATGAVTFSIGQAVGTSSNVTFNDLTVAGNLTVSGTTSTINSTTLNVADLNITVANGAATVAAANGAGLTVAGPATPATLTYTSADDRWNFNKTLNATLVGNVTGNVTGSAGTVTSISGNTLTSGQITTGLGFTPYNSTNPSGYTSNTGTVTGVTGTAPVVSSGGTAPAISMAAATSTVNGYMTSTYAAKLDGIAAGATNVTNTNQLTNGAGYVTSAGSVASASNATTVGGLAVHSGTNNVANQIVRTDGNGYIQAGWINTVSGDNGTTAIDRVYASGDAYLRYYTPANFRTVLDVPTRGGSGASGTWSISISGSSTSCSGNAATSSSCSGNAASASTASGVTVNYNNASASSYQMLWGSGNAVYANSNVTVNPSTGYITTTSINASDWFRSSGSTGWYNSTYAVGIYATEAGNVRTYNSANFISAGSITAAGEVTAYSDVRLKSNIKTLEGSLSKILQMRGVEYDKDDAHRIGVIAQEVQTVFPEVISVEANETQLLSVNYGALVAPLIEATKELNAKIESQANEIAELKALVHQLLSTK